MKQGRRPWIGVTTRWDVQRSLYVQDHRYLDALEWAGAVPVLIPLRSDAELIAEYGLKLDGLLLTGSPSDVDPRHYDAVAHEKLGAISEDRDRIDFQLLEIAEEEELPVFGICYGAQSLNVFRGGTLVQDIPSDIPGALEHNRAGPPQPGVSHEVRIEEGSRLAAFLGRREMAVNSYHHQSVAETGEHLRAVAAAPDGVVEGVEDTRHRFVLGVQWHPETAWQNDGLARVLFSEFVAAARKRSR